MSALHTPFRAMGCPCELHLHAPDHATARRVTALVRADIERLEAKYSRYRADSLLSRINAVAARGGEVDVDAETAGLLDYAQTCHAQSDGLFDITSGVLRAAWRFDHAEIPRAEDLAALCARIGWAHVNWRRPTLAFGRPGMALDFGGIVKEYAVDRAASLCAEEGIAHGIVNLGGDVRVLGSRPDGAAWRVGLAHPRVPGRTLETIALTAGAVATSGDYERCIVVDGVRYGHILNPRTGWPVRHLAAVSVVADLCVVAGSAATIALLKEEAGPAWLAALGLPHVWVDVQGRVGGPLASTPEIRGQTPISR
ncbi:MAG: FAD:protein FMN transferase [Gammaproteobacteria bacterium]